MDEKIEDGREKTELKEDRSILLPTNKNNSHKEDIQTMAVTTKKRHPRKLINTREQLEMMKNGLLEMFNVLINDQNEIMNFKNNRRNLLETLERNHYKTVCNRIRRRRHLIDMHNPISTIASTMEIALTYSLFKQNNEMIETGMETNETFTTDKIVARRWTRTEAILKTSAILTTGVTHIIMGHG